MDISKRIYPAIPHWVAALYGLLVLITIPWTVYIGLTLPSKNLSQHWDAAWVGLDIAIAIFLVLNALFSYLESKWLVMSATATTTLLIVDAWFDIITARYGRPFEISMASAIFVELPLAVLTFRVALRIINHEQLLNR
jgi:hypothetical protein